MEHTPRYGIRYLTRYKIIILGNKMIPDEFFDFDSPTPCTWIPLLRGWGGGRGKTRDFFACCGLLCVDSDLGSEEFFLVYGPHNPWRDLRSELLVPPPSPNGPLRVRTSVFSRLQASMRCLKTSKIRLFPKPFCRPRDGFGWLFWYPGSVSQASLVVWIWQPQRQRKTGSKRRNVLLPIHPTYNFNWYHLHRCHCWVLMLLDDKMLPLKESRPKITDLAETVTWNALSGQSP